MSTHWQLSQPRLEVDKSTAPSEQASVAADGQGVPHVPDAASADAPWSYLLVWWAGESLLEKSALSSSVDGHHDQDAACIEVNLGK